jgi:hypothetical protein
MDEAALIAQRNKQLAEVYDPQEQFIMQQKAALPGQFEGQRSALEQAKVNAFRDINLGAQRQGMFFSGFRPSEQARYLGERFLPGMQDITARQEQARLGLLEQLIGLRGQRAGESTKFQEQLRQENLARQNTEQDRAFQMQMQNRQIAASRGGGGGGASGPSFRDQLEYEKWLASQREKFKVETRPDGSVGYIGANGQPISAAAFAAGTGKSLTEVLSGDRTIYGQSAAAILRGDYKALGDLTRRAFATNSSWIPKGPPAKIRNNPTELAAWLQSNYKALF